MKKFITVIIILISFSFTTNQEESYIVSDKKTNQMIKFSKFVYRSEFGMDVLTIGLKKAKFVLILKQVGPKRTVVEVSEETFNNTNVGEIVTFNKKGKL